MPCHSAACCAGQGYFTVMVGKEHFERWVPKAVYAEQSYDRWLTYWMTNPYFRPPGGEWRFPFVKNGEPIRLDAGQQDFYKSDALTDHALGFLDEAVARDQPFFLYLPYHLPHFPLQARAEDISRFRSVYSGGWDELRRQRYRRAAALGVVPENASYPAPDSNINRFRGPYRGNVYKYRPWTEVPKAEQAQLSYEMAVYAAMVYRLDRNIGRILQALDGHGVSRNTLVLFFSDNGASPYDSNRDFAVPPGGADSFRTQTAAWSNAANSPYRYFKQYGHEGGGTRRSSRAGRNTYAQRRSCTRLPRGRHPAHVVTAGGRHVPAKRRRRAHPGTRRAFVALHAHGLQTNDRTRALDQWLHATIPQCQVRRREDRAHQRRGLVVIRP